MDLDEFSAKDATLSNLNPGNWSRKKKYSNYENQKWKRGHQNSSYRKKKDRKEKYFLKNLSANKSDTLDGIEEFVERHKLLKLTL